MLANAVYQSIHLSLTHRIREQARSHNLTESKPSVFCALLFCGSWLACDGINPVHLTYRGVRIAGKPAPTFDRVQAEDQHHI